MAGRSSSSSAAVGRTLCLKSPKLMLLETCSSLSQLKPIHAHMIRTHLFADVFSASRLLAFCTEPPLPGPADKHTATSSLLLDYAERVFSQIESPNLFVYNAMIRGSSAGENPSRSLRFYCQMQRRGIPPDNLTYPFVLKSCAQLGSVETGKQAHCRAVRRGFELDAYVQNSLVHMYAACGDVGAASRVFSGISRPDVVSWTSMITAYNRCGDVVSARQMFDDMPERNVVTWSSMISGYAKNGRFQEALELFQVMQSAPEKVRANETVMVSVISSCANLGALEQGERAHEYVVRNNLNVNLILGTALVEMYAKCGDVQRAIRVFEQLRERDVLSWTTVIMGLAIHGHAETSLEYFSKMVEAGTAPRDITFTAVLSACSHGGLVERGLELFERMRKDYGIEARLEHYGCMVDLLGRAGRLEEAKRFVLEMPMKPNAPIWGALLGACRIHKNAEMGEWVGKILTQLQPEHSGYIVLMSNIYARANRWEEVTELRRAMKERRVKKSPGHSLIELEGEVHRFVNGEKSHPEIDRIEAMWEEIVCRIRAVGYVGNTGDVLFDVEEEEKESALARHSEKLAIAFGIINTGRGSTIRIAKNLRVCEDCHTATKLVSEVFERELVVRDRNRFHHFKGGKCSCMDYW